MEREPITITPCPPAEVIIDRSFANNPPECLSKFIDIEIECTEDPGNPGYCVQKWKNLSLSQIQSQNNMGLCFVEVNSWLEIELEARGLTDGR